jgi:predicted MFS family arabinose efflux permease
LATEPRSRRHSHRRPGPQSGSGAGKPDTASRSGLDALNFFVAAAQTGFGAFLSVYLTEEHWTQTEIGVALSIGTVAAVVTRLPGGMLVDAIHTRRIPVAGGLLLLGTSALVLALWPQVVPVGVALVLHATAGSILSPAIAALTLSMCSHLIFSEQLGSNVRYASLGNAAAAGALGVVAGTSNGAVFLMTAALVIPALIALLWITPHQVDPDHDGHASRHHPKVRRARNRAQKHRPWYLYLNLPLHVFAVGVVLFHLANAAMLPLALNLLTVRGGGVGWVISASVMVPQTIVALLSPAAGRAAQQWGRRPLLLLGFAAVPARGFLLMFMPGAIGLVAVQALDGISATVFGIMLPLIAADLTERYGYLNLAIGSLGLAASLGGALSTTLAGWITDRFNAATAFGALAAAGAAAFLLILLAMPETRPAPRGSARDAAPLANRAGPRRDATEQS